ncbi:MAG: tRNA 2-thiouridine(34) synthase MnmA [Deltaproteobacteria bacterium]|nr:tRNA 2-thiouridine(34) synthase MnmA [Deltaproteobacteria bacterium]
MSDGPNLSELKLPGSRRVVIAMSGGVDSSVAAALLKEAGHEVIGATQKLQECHEAQGSRSCCGVDGIVRARAVAGQLGIAHYVIDCVREFEREVLRPAWDEYEHGRTPSPCLLCNERIKFGQLLAWSQRIGASCVATGHYARIERVADGRLVLLRGVDPEKDQSYFLAGLTPEQLSALLFPVGHLTKPEVRSIGRTLGLSTAETHDSQDACLVGPDQSFAEMLRGRFSAVTTGGVIVDDSGEVIGRHAGVHHFTVGQRRGLGVSSTTRRWVREIRAENDVVVATDREDALLSRHLVAKGMSWLTPPPIDDDTLECEVQIRYRHTPAPATVAPRGDGTVAVTFNEPVRAITPGQAAVFYDGGRVLGRGWIDVR